MRGEIDLAQVAAYPTDTITDPFMGSEPPRTSNRIIDYRQIRNWENYFLASAICSVAVATGADEDVLRTLGRETVNGLHFFSAITGDMFTPLYNADKQADSGITNYFFMPQVVKQAYAAFGRECIYLSTAQIGRDFRATMNAIKASVDNGIPVLAWGMGNVTLGDGSRYDPLPEGCLIGGYDRDNLLYVNLYPGPERMLGVDEDGYSAITHGLDTTKGLFFVGNPIPKPEERDIYYVAIERIPSWLTLPPTDGYVFGQAAFEKWAETLLDERRFAGKTDEALTGLCWDLHCSPYCNILTSAAEAYLRAAVEVHAIARAHQVLPLYEQLTKLRQDIWTLQGDFFPPMDRFRTREFRLEIADKLRHMGRVCGDIVRAFDTEAER